MENCHMETNSIEFVSIMSTRKGELIIIGMGAFIGKFAQASLILKESANNNKYAIVDLPESTVADLIETLDVEAMNQHMKRKQDVQRLIEDIANSTLQIDEPISIIEEKKYERPFPKTINKTRISAGPTIARTVMCNGRVQRFR